MIICDLHTHSTASDGKYSPSEVVRKAYERGVKYLALTDHDTLSGIEEAKTEAKKLDINFIPGIELSTTYKGETVHILGYFKSDYYKNPKLNAFLEDLKTKRIERARSISLCCIWRTRCLRTATKPLLSLLENRFPGRLSINRRLLRSGRSM